MPPRRGCLEQFFRGEAILEFVKWCQTIKRYKISRNHRSPFCRFDLFGFALSPTRGHVVQAAAEVAVSESSAQISSDAGRFDMRKTKSRKESKRKGPES